MGVGGHNHLSDSTLASLILVLEIDGNTRPLDFGEGGGGIQL